MKIGLALFVGAIIGLVIGVVVGRRLAGLPGLQPARVLNASDLVSPQLEQAVDLVRTPALVVGPHDEVLHANVPARSIGVVRGSRVAPQPLLDAIREARLAGEPRSTRFELGQTRLSAGREFDARIALLDHGIELAVADDHSAQQRTDDMRRDFVTNVSHELKTPVGAMRVLAEAVREASDDPVAVARFGSKMIKESDRLAELITQIIELSRLQAQDPLADAKPILVDDVVEAAVSGVGELADSKSVKMTTAGERGLKVVGDLAQLASAVSNLVVNAVTYSNESGRVVVNTSEVDEDGERYVIIAVSDNGIGIKSDEFERIFERFYRVDDHRSRDNGGTGLGLSIVKHIAAAHGGDVSVWSKVGQGSTFTLRLPSYLPETTEN